MRNEPQETLIDLGFKVRLDKDGNEVEKPIHPTHECSSFCKNCDQFALEIDKYKQATPVIKLPSPVEFWNAIDPKYTDGTWGTPTGVKAMRLYMNFIQTPLTKEMFVNELEKPKGKKCCGGLQSGSDCDCKGELVADQGDVNEWKKSEEKVLFHGWEYSHSDSVEFCWGYTFKDYLLNWDFQENKMIDGDEIVNTIHDLQKQDVQLYLKIK